jgi:hypothetical protein
VEPWRIEGERIDETRLQAVIKMEVACRLALESLPDLPRETEEALRAPIETLCKVTAAELERLQPGLAAGDGRPD